LQNLLDLFSRFETDHKCDEQTEGRIDKIVTVLAYIRYAVMISHADFVFVGKCMPVNLFYNFRDIGIRKVAKAETILKVTPLKIISSGTSR